MNGLDFDGSGSLDKPGGAFCSDWLGVAELREALRLGRVTARQLTDDAIARIEAGDRSINAVV
ncbi:MAG TPA: hypothetical protein DEB25_00560, partial [Desulfobulbaceae bacterium]|nr:hypothetical protein [Desulfobulbaceae bacterium]